MHLHGLSVLKVRGKKESLYKMSMDTILRANKDLTRFNDRQFPDPIKLLITLIIQTNCSYAIELVIHLFGRQEHAEEISCSE